jgi:hypothetical protein
MDQNTATRKSFCSICGKRLSEKTASGAILWHAGGVDDKGIYCESCKKPKKSNSGRKKART